VGVIAGGISSNCWAGGNCGRAVGAGRGRKLGSDCGAGGATSSGCCANTVSGTDMNITAANATNPTPRRITFAAYSKTFPKDLPDSDYFKPRNKI
jgi:hypothetical protein